MLTWSGGCGAIGLAVVVRPKRGFHYGTATDVGSDPAPDLAPGHTPGGS